ncbi:ChbG/HpnK family deacetylase [Streptomyces armeniacus]|uniref:ChbG/HpnK family deacetylase n=1 Tax=Streptomyces armeniacus TaxID=83291 RepID=A0A345XYV0_9ACTN|nr:polysaccharide deacetylase family protein [Streptomyces armeniacus]AXK36816.1 ChbG/HpnK family deacetylase [Streptomyces armeniacus]
MAESAGHDGTCAGDGSGSGTGNGSGGGFGDGTGSGSGSGDGSGSGSGSGDGSGTGDDRDTRSSSELLGFAPGARVLIVNADDFGMYHAVNTAVIDAIEQGIASSCSLMVPCPGAPEAMRLLRERPEIPFGVHLTLFCDTARAPHQWGPLAAPESVPSLLDEEGELFSPDGVPELLAQARLEDVEREFRAQINAVLAAGLRPTHLDWHCLADGGRDDIFDLTASLAAEHGLAVRVWLDPARRKTRPRGLPVTDHPFLDSFSLGLDGKADRYAELLRSLPAGLSEWAVHPGLDDADARTADPGGWSVRSTDHAFLTSPRARELVDREGVIVTDYRTVQRLWQRAASA